MRKTIGIFVLLLAFTINLSAETKPVVNEEVTFESCVSIAADVSGGNSYYFALAYDYCIYSRCNCFK